MDFTQSELVYLAALLNERYDLWQEALDNVGVVNEDGSKYVVMPKEPGEVAVQELETLYSCTEKLLQGNEDKHFLLPTKGRMEWFKQSVEYGTTTLEEQLDLNERMMMEGMSTEYDTGN